MSKSRTDSLTETLAVRCSPELKQAVEREAERRHVRVSDLIRMTLSDLVTPKPWKDNSRPMRNV